MKKLSLFLLILLLLVSAGVYFARDIIFQEVEEEVIIENTSLQVPEFNEAEIDFSHKWDKTNSLAFAGGALIDVDGDGLQEVFIGGGNGQQDALFAYQNGKFVNIIEGKGLSSSETTYGALSLDFEKDGDSDLIVARENGVFIYENNGQGEFESEKVDFELPQNAVPVSLAAGDINKDGYIDLYVSTFVNAKNFRSATFNDPTHAKANVLLVNNKEGGFIDVTKESGIDGHQNTFLSSWVDLNSDNNLDLVIAENTGKVRIFNNLGDLKFKEVELPVDYGFWMGLAIADLDHDGDQDIFASNIGNTIPANLAKGDLKDEQTFAADWILLRNEGEFKFVDATSALGLSGFEFAWGALFDDFNLDGYEDLIVLENYIKWAPHKLKKAPGRFFIQDFDGKFLPVTGQAGLINEHFGMSPLISDFNNDGYPDLILINLEGPVRAFINKGGLDHHYLKVKFAETAENYGATVKVKRADGVAITKQVISGMGLFSDGAGELFFGLGKADKIESVEVLWPSGDTKILEDVQIDSSLEF